MYFLKLFNERGAGVVPLEIRHGVGLGSEVLGLHKFAQDPDLVTRVFQSACEFVARVPVYRLGFVPDATVWELIR